MPNFLLDTHNSYHFDNDSKAFSILIAELQKKHERVKTKKVSLTKFELIKTRHKVQIGRRVGLKNQLHHICELLEVQYGFNYNEVSTHEMGKNISEFRTYPFFLFQHSADLGHVIIRPETIGDKISELFNSIDIDFKKHKKFSFKYFVSSENSEKVRANMPDALLHYLKNLNGVSIELIDGFCLICNNKAISNDNGLPLSQIAFDIKEILK